MIIGIDLTMPMPNANSHHGRFQPYFDHQQSSRDAQEEVAQRRSTERRQEQSRQSSNNQREGTLGMLPPRRGTGIPSLQEADDFRRAQEAASLLAANPISQNNAGTTGRPVLPLGSTPQQPVGQTVGGRGDG